MPRRRRAILFLCVPLFVVAAGIAGVRAPAAWADAEETEKRLKSAGVPDDLRPKIHEAIDRSVAWIARQGRSNGRFTDGHVGYSVLAALALRHAGTPVAKAALEKALVGLLPMDGRLSPALYDDVYTAGLATMLLEPDRDPRRQGVAKDIARRIPGGIDPSYGLWWYSTLGREGVNAPAALVRTGSPNLSTSQFACLGMWAGSRLGVPQPTTTWRIHLDRLARMLESTGGFCYRDHTTGLDEGRPYWTATFMAHADITLGRAALLNAVPAGDPDRVRFDRLQEAADGLLQRDAALLLKSVANGDPGLGDVGNLFANAWSYYGLYALEKACVFAGIEKVGDVRWYVTGAEHLLRVQSNDGGWGLASHAPAVPLANAVPADRLSDLVSTAFALLFLVRSSEHYRPSTPRDIDTPAPPTVTPKDPAPGMK